MQESHTEVLIDANVDSCVKRLDRATAAIERLNKAYKGAEIALGELKNMPIEILMSTKDHSKKWWQFWK